jgi:hypothetical protein
MTSPTHRAAIVTEIRRAMTVAEIRRGAGVAMPPAVRAIMERVRVILLRRLAEETAIALNAEVKRTGLAPTEVAAVMGAMLDAAAADEKRSTAR